VLFPSKIRAGDFIQWKLNATNDVYGNPISSPDWTVSFFLRTNKSKVGTSVQSTADGDDFKFEIPSSTSIQFSTGEWFYQAVASKSGNQKQTIATGKFTVLPSLEFTGTTPKPFDGRSETKKTLDLINAAIEDIVKNGGVQEYKIGTRSAKKYELGELYILRTQYLAQVRLEEQAETMANGLGNPRAMFVRFKK
tara:strand:+ start:724 stop:1305 length:582 start_codon:yes stop_codon:yes gene_type:complete